MYICGLHQSYSTVTGYAYERNKTLSRVCAIAPSVCVCVCVCVCGSVKEDAANAKSLRTYTWIVEGANTKCAFGMWVVRGCRED